MPCGRERVTCWSRLDLNKNINICSRFTSPCLLKISDVKEVNSVTIMLCIVVVTGGMFSYEDKFIFTFSHQTDQTACHWTLNRFLLTTHSLPLKISLRAKACRAH